MHARETELVLEEVTLSAGSPLLGMSLSEARVRDRTGTLVLALHDADAGLVSNPAADVVMSDGQSLIAIGTPAQLEKLTEIAGGQREVQQAP
jgi:K+/H+ antiporter YhaU regulatory subunit KhtT